jgi:rubrerythrin
MELGAVLLLLAVLVMVVLFVARPLMNRSSEPLATPQAESALLAERDRILSDLQELDFDYTLGKIPAEDYPVQRSLLVQRGAEILRQLDEIERQAARSTARRAARKRRLSDEDIEALIAQRRQARREKAAGFCPRCGRPVLRSDKFCPACGHHLKK